MSQEFVIPPSRREVARGLRVLVVEDDPAALELYSTALSGAGAVVFSASSASEALATLEREMVHVLVSDVGLPDMEGNTLLRTIREMAPPLSAVAAVAVTASRGDDLVDEANRAGFHVYASKPIATSDLVGIVVALGRPTLEDELNPAVKMTQP
jgi:CheY-like chemotaxis protein